jgi:hypothetical protein
MEQKCVGLAIKKFPEADNQIVSSTPILVTINMIQAIIRFVATFLPIFCFLKVESTSSYDTMAVNDLNKALQL